jgi:hypothetical protein
VATAKTTNEAPDPSYGETRLKPIAAPNVPPRP